MTYKVTWEIEFEDDEADSARHAAELAHGVMLDPDSWALYFTVNGEPVNLLGDDDPDGPADDAWIQSQLERAAGPPRRSTEFYDNGKLRRN
jgi:hypothetical protein